MRGESEVERIDREIMRLDRGEQLVYYTGITGSAHHKDCSRSIFKHVGRLADAEFVTLAQRLVSRNDFGVGTYEYIAYGR